MLDNKAHTYLKLLALYIMMSTTLYLSREVVLDADAEDIYKSKVPIYLC